MHRLFFNNTIQSSLEQRQFSLLNRVNLYCRTMHWIYGNSVFLSEHVSCACTYASCIYKEVGFYLNFMHLIFSLFNKLFPGFHHGQSLEKQLWDGNLRHCQELYYISYDNSQVARKRTFYQLLPQSWNQEEFT